MKRSAPWMPAKGKKYSENIGGVEFSGDTKAEVTEAIKQAADKAFSGSYNPVIVRHGKYSGIVWRDQNGWNSAPCDVVSDGIQDIRMHQVGFDDRQSAVNNLVYDMCVKAWEFGKPELMKVPEILPEKMRADYESLVGFYHKHRILTVAGFNTNDAHAIAGGMFSQNHVDKMSDEQKQVVKEMYPNNLLVN